MIHSRNAYLHNWELIADQLAQQSYAVVDQFLSTEQVILFHQLVFDYYQSGQFKNAGVGRGSNYLEKEKVRGDQIYWLSENTTEPLIKNYWEDIDRLSQYLNRTCFLGLSSSEFHFAVYPVGKEYKRHLDVFKDSDTRKISVVVYLNPEWHADWGGALRLYLPEGTVDIDPVGGRMVCMRSELIEHAVLPVKKERYSLTGWLRSSETRLI